MSSETSVSIAHEIVGIINSDATIDHKGGRLDFTIPHQRPLRQQLMLLPSLDHPLAGLPVSPNTLQIYLHIFLNIILDLNYYNDYKYLAFGTKIQTNLAIFIIPESLEGMRIRLLLKFHFQNIVIYSCRNSPPRGSHGEGSYHLHLLRLRVRSLFACRGRLRGRSLALAISSTLARPPLY